MTARLKEPARGAPLDQVDPIVARLVPVLRRMVASEVERLKVPAPRVLMARPEAEILRACRMVAEAADRLAQARYTQAEIPARRALERAALSLRRAMEKHGRWPGEGGSCGA